MMGNIKIENEPTLLSIGGLSKMCGVAVETLRTWEKRYGFPTPTRLASGHRRYPPDAAARVRLIKRGTDLGLKASFAVKAPAEELALAIKEAEAQTAPPLPGLEPAEIEAELNTWLSLSQNLDGAGIEAALTRSWCKYPAKDFIFKLAIPFLTEVGERWFKKEISVAHEHFTSEHLDNFIGNQWRALSQQGTRGKAVVTNLEGDHHHLGIHMASVFIALNGFEVVFLGANTPVDDIIVAARQEDVITTVIGLTATTDLKKATQRLKVLRESIPASTTIVIGGNSLIRPIKGLTYLESLEQFADFTQSLSQIYSENTQ